MASSIRQLKLKIAHSTNRVKRKEREIKLLKNYVNALEKLSVISIDKANASKAAKAKRKLLLFSAERRDDHRLKNLKSNDY
jgi:hypothetical protein